MRAADSRPYARLLELTLFGNPDCSYHFVRSPNMIQLRSPLKIKQFSKIKAIHTLKVWMAFLFCLILKTP